MVEKGLLWSMCAVRFGRWWRLVQLEMGAGGDGPRAALETQGRLEMGGAGDVRRDMGSGAPLEMGTLGDGH